MLLNVFSKSHKVEIITPSRKKPNTAKTKNTLLKSQINKSKKHHILRMPIILNVMFLVCPKSPFLVLAAKSMSLFSPFQFRKKLNYPPKILILTNVKTSPLQENINIDDDVLVLMKKRMLKGVFGFGSIQFVVVVIWYYTFSNKIVFLLSFFDPV